jgi:hypothetical protein
MAQTCSKCSRSNPAEALYCYFDGFVLSGHGRLGGPLAIGARAFSSPFVFPNGRTCRSFDELAMACQEEWATAGELLRQGFLETFLRGIGRADLAGAAQAASRFPDRERGLDQLLGRLPSSALAEPKLRVEPLEVNLGLLDNDRERTFPLHLENQGMRLLYGTVSCGDSVWLGLGDVPGVTEKHFQFTHEAALSVRVHPDRARASTRPVEARLVVESNGGSITVVVKLERPIKPFSRGCLAGAKSPRQIAEKCKANPKEAGPLFEAGEVEKWYQLNGWTYPVKIPAASGMAAVQQFFEALGLVKPPRVDINRREYALQGEAGARLHLEPLAVSNQEKKITFAHATSSEPWLEVSRAKFDGAIATLKMSIPSVPNQPGQTLTAQLSVVANGNQKFHVPVRLEVLGSASSAFDFDAPAGPLPALTRPGSPPPPPPPRVADVEPVPAARRLDLELEEPRPRARKPAGKPLGMHLVPAVLLGLAVAGVVAFDLTDRGSPDEGPEGAGQGVMNWNYDLDKLRDRDPRIMAQFTSESRFGLVRLDAQDPKNKDKWKRLTYDEHGGTNNTRVKIADSDYKFGFVTQYNKWSRDGRLVRVPAPRTGWLSTMDFRGEKVRVTQHVEIVPGETGLLDTCLVHYEIHNYGTVPQKVGLRVMLDTFIGDNDGVPFTIPGRKEFVTRKEDLQGDKIPDYIEVVERPDDEKDPGTTARLQLRGLQLPDGIELEEPQMLRISQFPGSEIGWDWEPRDMGGDSAVAIYWPYEMLKPQETRHVAFTYGLGKLDIADQLALSAPVSVMPNREFVVTAYVYNAEAGQKVTIDLPEGMVLSRGESAEKVVEEGGKRTQVFWRVRATREQTFRIEATSGKSRARPREVRVSAKSIFG